MNKQKGFTLTELITCFIGLAGLGLIVFALYAAIHFLLKFW